MCVCACAHVCVCKPKFQKRKKNYSLEKSNPGEKNQHKTWKKNQDEFGAKTKEITTHYYTTQKNQA